jgi:hypothetical protein
MLEFLASIMDVGGNLPMFGDADDAYVARSTRAPASAASSRRSRPARSSSSAREFSAKAGALDDKTRWLIGPDADIRYGTLRGRAGALPVHTEFPEGGYCILGTDFETPDEIRVVADAGPLGYREIAAHGHADALSFTLSVGGVEFLVDPGTFAYHTETQWRAYFRGTSAHNTVRIDGLDQSEQGGNFMWLRKAKAERMAWTSTADEDRFEGCHDGYAGLEDPVTHCRRIVLDKRSRTLRIEDELQMRGAHAVEVFFHCAEDTLATPIPGGVSLARHGAVDQGALAPGGGRRDGGPPRQHRSDRRLGLAAIRPQDRGPDAGVARESHRAGAAAHGNRTAEQSGGALVQRLRRMDYARWGNSP